MPRRTVRIKLAYDVVIDDERDGVPWVSEKDIAAFALNGCKSLQGLTEVKNIKLEMGLDRESKNEMLRRAGVIRANRK